MVAGLGVGMQSPGLRRLGGRGLSGEGASPLRGFPAVPPGSRGKGGDAVRRCVAAAASRARFLKSGRPWARERTVHAP